MVKKSRKKIVIISHDKIGATMAGPGIRYHHMAEVLSTDFDVTIGFFDPSYLPDADFQRSYSVQSIDSNHFQASFVDVDIIIALYLTPDMIKYCNKNNIFIIIDIYAPVPVENLALELFSGRELTRARDYSHAQSCAMYRKFFEAADLFLISNRRQFDFWMGYIFGSDLIRVSSYNKRPVFNRIIEAPMGIDTSLDIRQTKKALRGVLPGISSNDRVLLWTGGIYNWFDGTVLINAMSRLEKIRPDIKLVFFGAKHPNPDVLEMIETKTTIDIARKNGLLNKTVFVHEGWVPYSERLNYLLEADAAINTSKDSFEAEFSHRTRVLDHILVGLPTICTKGDYLSDEVISKHELGLAVEPHDSEQLVEAILNVLDSTNHNRYKRNIMAVREDFDWHKTLNNLSKYLKGEPQKLPQLIIKHRRPPNYSKSYALARRLTPLKVKKLIIRALRYGS